MLAILQLAYMIIVVENILYYSIDATNNDGSKGRLINHCKKGNLTPKVIVIDTIPHIIFIAKKDIRRDEELLYDYGERRKHILDAFPWLGH